MLNLTSEKIRKEFQKLAQYQTPANLQRLNQKQQEQQQRELRLITTQAPCPVNRLNTVQDALPNLNPEAFQTLIRDQFYNGELLQNLMCVADSVYYASGSKLEYNQRVREWFQHLRQIGSESVFGYAMLASFKSARDLFVVKAPRTTQGDDLQHELFVGMFGTNRLRKYIPNFAYVFGGFRCSPPLIEPTSKDVVAWCNQPQGVNYVLYENIAPSISFQEYITARTTPAAFLNKYLQIIYALKKAQAVCDFTHYDLHTQNVLVRTIDKPTFAIPYETERGLEYLQTDGIATFIDYGYSHITYERRGYGQWRLIGSGIFPDRSFPLSDAYKFLLHCYARCLQVRNTALQVELTKILRFFNPTETPAAMLKQQQPNYFYLPWVPELKTVTLDAFARYIRQICAPHCTFLTTVPPTSLKILSCKHAVCARPEDALSLVGLTRPTAPRTLVEAYDVLSKLTGETQRARLATLDVPTLLRSGQEELSEHIEQALALGRVLRPVNLTGAKLAVVLNPTTLFQMRRYVNQTAALYDLLQQIDVLYRAYSYLAGLIGAPGLDGYDGVIMGLRGKIEAGARRIREDNLYLKTLRQQNGPALLRALQRDPSLGWYWDGFQAFFMMLGWS